VLPSFVRSGGIAGPSHISGVVSRGQAGIGADYGNPASDNDRPDADAERGAIKGSEAASRLCAVAYFFGCACMVRLNFWLAWLP